MDLLLGFQTYQKCNNFTTSANLKAQISKLCRFDTKQATTRENKIAQNK
jgi:hypothetical protein